jgi:predicted enzyme related to lactoylglutathione lyase
LRFVDGVLIQSNVVSLQIRASAAAADAMHRRPAETDMVNSHLSHGSFVWYELMTTNLDAAKAFYADVMGWGTQDASQSYTLFTAAGSSVSGLLELPEEARRMDARPGWMGYVGVDDVDATAERIAQLDGTVFVPPQEVANISRIAIICDPQMAMLGLLKWLQPEQHQAEDLRAPGRIGWHELLAADWENAWDFYAELFGWQKADADVGPVGTYQLFSAAGETIGGMFTKPAAVAAPFWLYYFNVADIDAAAKCLKSAHGQILDGPIEVPGDRWILQCTDPQGALFGLVGRRRHHGIGYFAPATPPPRRSGI